MIKISGKSNTRDYFRLFVHWKRRCLETNIWRLFFLVLSILLFQSLEDPMQLYSTYKGKHDKVLLLLIIFCLGICILLITYIFIYEYVLAYKCWKRNFLIKEMGTSIQTMEFNEDFVEIRGMILHQKVRHKVFYKEMKNVRIYKQGLVIIDGKDSILVCRSNFLKQDEYDQVCRWISILRDYKEG